MATCDVNLVQNALGIQQTGPRTVIVLADPIIWSANTSYEYLTLVASTDFGQAYISKKDVPAGTPLTNTDYWLPAAQFNAQLAQLQEQVATINATLNTLGTTVDANEQTIAKIGYGNSTLIPYGSYKFTSNPNGLISQSLCWDGGDNIYIAFGNQANNAQRICKCSIASDTVTTQDYSIANAHFNSIEYYDGYLYATSSVSSTCYRINPSNLSSYTTLALPRVYTSLKRVNGKWYGKRAYSNGSFIIDVLSDNFAVESSHTVTMTGPTGANYNNICAYNGSDLVVSCGRSLIVIDGTTFKPRANFSEEGQYKYFEFEDTCLVDGVYVTLGNAYDGFALNVMTGLNPAFAQIYTTDTTIHYGETGAWKTNINGSTVVVHHPMVANYYLRFASSLTLDTDVSDIAWNQRAIVIYGNNHVLTNATFHGCVVECQNVTFNHTEEADNQYLFDACLVFISGGTRFTADAPYSIRNTTFVSRQYSNPNLNTNVTTNCVRFLTSSISSQFYPLYVPSKPTRDDITPTLVNNETFLDLLRSGQAYVIVGTSASAANGYGRININASATHTNTFSGVGIANNKIVGIGLVWNTDHLEIASLADSSGSTSYYVEGIYYA